MEKYFKGWGNKVNVDTFKVLLEEKKWKEINVE